MAVNNVFQMMAQQEMDKYNQAPQRRLQELQIQQQEAQLKQQMAEHEYQQQARSALAVPQQGPTLASMGPQHQPFNPAQGPQLASLDPNAGASLPEQKPLTIVDQFKRQYDYHTQNGRADLAQGVMEHQIDLSMKAAKVAEHAFKTGGKEGLAAWLQANPNFAPLLGDPGQMHINKDGVLFAATDEKGQPVPGMFWHRGEDGRPVFKEIKPSQAQTFAPGVGISDGKGGYTVPVPAAEKPDAEAMLDKRLAAQAANTQKQIDAADRRAMRTAYGGMGKLDFESGKALVKGLPKLKEEAMGANGSIERIDTMLNLVKGGVGGKKGQILSALAPYAEMIGVNTKSMNDAQTYEIMAKTIGGSMRMQIVGPGPVSNYENQLLQKISGGGSAATPAATELLSYYRKMAKEKVDDYNGSVDAVSEFSPATRKIYRPIGQGATPARVKGGSNKDPLGIL